MSRAKLKKNVAKPKPAAVVQSNESKALEDTRQDVAKAMMNHLSESLHATLPEVIHQAVYQCVMDAARTFRCM